MPSIPFIYILLLIFYNQHCCSKMMRKLSQYRGQSPIRSPIRNQPRAVSPIRSSPFGRQAPMSPIRSRRIDQSNKAKISTTPKKTRHTNQQFYRTNYSNTAYKTSGNNEMNLMQMTIKKGQGLFQQLASANRAMGDRKDTNMNRISSHINPFEQNESTNKNSNKINNVQNIESTSFKQSQKMGKIENTIKLANTYNMLESFGTQKQSQIVSKIQLIPDSKLQEQQAQQEKPEENQQDNQQWSELNVRVSINKTEQNQIKEQGPSVISSFEDILFLIRKAGERNKQNTIQVIEDHVQNSITKSKFSFNMNPFLQ